MRNPRIEPNMGVVDRCIRGILGSVLLWHGISREDGGLLARVESILGGIILLYSAMGVDPLLQAAGASTRKGDKANIFNLIRQVIPGQGTNPRFTQQPLPQMLLAQIRPPTIPEILTVG